MSSQLVSQPPECPCPKCGSTPAPEWVKGWRGWTCGSYLSGHDEPKTLVQSVPCAYQQGRREATDATLVAWLDKLTNVVQDLPHVNYATCKELDALRDAHKAKPTHD